MNTVAAPTKIPSVDQPIAIPKIRGMVPLRPCWEPCAAHSTLLGPGVKHIGMMKARVARRRSVSMPKPQARLSRKAPAAAKALSISAHISSTSSIPTLILTKPGTTPASLRTSSGTNM